MKKILLLFTFTALFTNLSAQQEEQAGYTGFLTQALEAAKNYDEQEFTINMKYFSTAIEENNITPKILTEENYKLYSKCMAEGVVKGYEDFDVQQAKEFVAYNTEDYPDNLFLLGRLYQMEGNYSKAKEWYEKAIEKGNATAMNNLGAMYDMGEDYTKAKELYEEAANKGSAEAMFHLGGMYANAVGVEQDFIIAKEWYEKAAEKGIANAMHNLGSMYYNGEGVKQDYTKAKQWYEKAVEKGDASSMNDLGAIYYYGLGVVQDSGKSKEWFKKACDAGDETGCQNYEALNK